MYEDQSLYQKLQRAWTKAEVKLAYDEHKLREMQRLQRAAEQPGYLTRLTGMQCVHADCGEMVETYERRANTWYAIPCGCPQCRGDHPNRVEFY